MKKRIQSIALSLLVALSSCHTSSSSSTSVTPATPTSTFNITYNGKTYHLTSSAPGTVPATVISAITASSSSPAQWGATLVAQNSHIQCSFMAEKVTNLSTAIGTYNEVGCGGGVTHSTLNLTDMDDGNKRYETDCTGHDTTGSITITVSNSSECKGTFSLTLSYNGNYYPATGDFDYKH